MLLDAMCWIIAVTQNPTNNSKYVLSSSVNYSIFTLFLKLHSIFLTL